MISFYCAKPTTMSARGLLVTDLVNLVELMITLWWKDKHVKLYSVTIGYDVQSSMNNYKNWACVKILTLS